MAYIKKVKAKGRTYYELVEGYRDESGKRKVRYLKSLGKDPTKFLESLSDAAELVDILRKAPHLLNNINLKRLTVEAKRQAERVNDKLSLSNVEPIPMGPFSAISIDPPWDWGDEGDADQFGRARPTYKTMTLKEIEALPVLSRADDNCHLYLWITNRSLPKGFDLLRVWGFRFVTVLTWAKPYYGIGNYFRGQTEHIIFGVKGSLPLLRHDVGTLLAYPRGRNHSSKPDEILGLLASCSPEPRLEMFARREHKGWVPWGNMEQ